MIQQSYSWAYIQRKLLLEMREFPDSTLVKTSHFNAGGAGSIPGLRPKIPHVSGPRIKT